jgi:hypothetical protein
VPALVKAYILLAFAFLKTVFTRWFGIGKRYGLPAFNRNYASDHLSAMRPDDAEVLLGAARCIACRRCESGDDALRSAHGDAYPGMMTLVLSSARDTTAANSAARAWALVPSLELARRETLCPEGVPIRKLAALVVHHAQQA